MRMDIAPPESPSMIRAEVPQAQTDMQDVRYVIHTITFFTVSCPENSAFSEKNQQIFEIKIQFFAGKIHFFVTENGTKSESVNHIPNLLYLQEVFVIRQAAKLGEKRRDRERLSDAGFLLLIPLVGEPGLFHTGHLGA